MSTINIVIVSDEELTSYINAMKSDKVNNMYTVKYTEDNVIHMENINSIKSANSQTYFVITHNTFVDNMLDKEFTFEFENKKSNKHRYILDFVDNRTIFETKHKELFDFCAKHEVICFMNTPDD